MVAGSAGGKLILSFRGFWSTWVCKCFLYGQGCLNSFKQMLHCQKQYEKRFRFIQFNRKSITLYGLAPVCVGISGKSIRIICLNSRRQSKTYDIPCWTSSWRFAHSTGWSKSDKIVLYPFEITSDVLTIYKAYCQYVASCVASDRSCASTSYRIDDTCAASRLSGFWNYSVIHDNR